jgi:hypothetical protein
VQALRADAASSLQLPLPLLFLLHKLLSCRPVPHPPLQVQALRADAASSQDSSLGMLAGLADGQQALSDRLEAAVAALRKEMKPSLQQVDVVCRAVGCCRGGLKGMHGCS